MSKTGALFEVEPNFSVDMSKLVHVNVSYDTDLLRICLEHLFHQSKKHDILIGKLLRDRQFQNEIRQKGQLDSVENSPQLKK